MFGYEEIGISFSFHFIYLFIALLLIAGYSYFTYKFTVPPTGKLQKTILINLRTVALLLLVIIFFEPILNLVTKEAITPFNLVLIDNSRSMSIDDQTNRKETTLKIAEELTKHSKTKNLKFYKFGSIVEELLEDSLNKINFTDGVTNISDVFNSVQKDEANLSSIILITDGVFNSGDNPYYAAIKAGTPVFTIGIGDTIRRKDVEVKKVLYNEVVYVETPTTVAATIQNYGFEESEITVSLSEMDQLVSSQKIKLSGSGIQNVSFDYIPETSGEKKLSVVISDLKGEFTSANNKRVFYLNVLSNKIRVLLLASSPSSDLSFIKNTLLQDENLTINSITQISSSQFLEKTNYSLIDSADIFFLIGFPSDNTPEELWRKVQGKISNEKVPYFLMLSPDISLNRLSSLRAELSFTIGQNLTGYRNVQPEISPANINHPLFQHSSLKILEDWNNLPPVLQPNDLFLSKPDSRMLASIKVNNKLINSPLMLLRNFSGRKSITVLARDIWRWKLQTAVKRSDLFDSFILNSARWLNVLDEQEKVSIKTSKKSYSQGERIEFSSQVFDESLNPVSNAEIKIKIKSVNNLHETELQSIGAGIYDGSIAINETGDFSFSGEAVLDGNKLGADNGTFNIGEIDFEVIDPLMNYSLLNLIANDTGGEYYSPDNYTELLQKIDELNKIASKEKTSTSEIKLWSNEWLLIIAILLFSLEWFLRKRIGLL